MCTFYSVQARVSVSSYFSASYTAQHTPESTRMDQLLSLGSHNPTDTHRHPLVTFGRGEEEVEEKQKPRIKPSQIYQNYKTVKPKSLKNAASQ